MRVTVMLDAAIKRSNWALRNAEDPTGMKLLGYGFEWAEQDAVASRPWIGGYFTFRIDDDGENWHIVRHENRAAIFDERLLPLPP